jgi:hypothetical protein
MSDWTWIIVVPNVTDLIKALLGNSSVKTFKRATIEAMSQ